MPRVNTISDGYTKLQKGSRAGLVIQGYDYSLFDTEIINNSQVSYRFFTTAVGVNGKTIADTNMKVGGQLPQGKKLTVKGIKIGYLPISIKTGYNFQAILNCLNKSVLRFLVDGKEDLGTWTLSELMGFNLPVIADVLDGDNPCDFSTTIRDAVKNYFPLNIPIELPSNQIFELEMSHISTPAVSMNGDLLRIMLTGYMENLQ